MKRKNSRMRRNGRVGRELGEAQLGAVAALFDVLSEPSRLRILQELHFGEASVGELVDRCEIKQANMSKQLGVLTSAGLIARRQDGNRAIYRIDMPLVLDLCSLVCHGLAEKVDQRARALRSR